jgi:2-polyprenyl-3-methyl-5-hydroxy-6-metoxy-1,4-benzoquinol methylase
MKRFILFLKNNVLINQLLILFKIDAKRELAAKQWKVFHYDSQKSEQQNAGFSHTTEVEEALEKVKKKLVNTLQANLSSKDKVLDIGCGPGIYMQLLTPSFTLHGIDISENMLKEAATKLPSAKLYLGNFLNIKFEGTFQAIYAISVLEYVPVSELKKFFEKCTNLLSPNGILILQYPHALRVLDLWYPDRNYICYSPQKISDTASQWLDIVEHNQSYDGRPICRYDKRPYSTSGKTFKNGYLLIARKR